jgi:hypothetical protein
MPSLLKSVALAAGTGIVLGLYATSARTPRLAPENPGAPDPLLLEPLLDRLEQVESQLLKSEASGTATAEVQSLRQSMVAQEAELQTLRAKVCETERRAAAAAESAEARLRQFQANLNTQMGELRSRIEAQVEFMVAERVGALEQAVADQETSTGGLRDRAVEFDANLQRLIALVERFYDRSPQPSSTVLPFESQLAEAVQRDVPGESRVRVIKETKPNEPDPRHRFPRGRTFAFLLALLLPNFYR